MSGYVAAALWRPDSAGRRRSPIELGPFCAVGLTYLPLRPTPGIVRFEHEWTGKANHQAVTCYQL